MRYFLFSLLCLLACARLAGAAMPIGIPEPAFGLTNQRPARPDPWTNEVAGHYYIDQATGSNTRTYGYPGSPRKDPPTLGISAGSVVEIAGTWNGGGNGIYYTFLGTPENPCWFVGPTNGYAILTNGVFVIGGTNFIFEGIHFRAKALFGHTSLARHTILDGAVRGCKFQGDGAANKIGTGMSIGGTTNGVVSVSNLVVFNNEMWNYGDATTALDQDSTPIIIVWSSSSIWILNNTLHDCSGPGARVGGQSGEDPTTMHHVYFGSNHIYRARQAGIGIKSSHDIIVSQNTIHHIIDASWSASKGIGAQYNVCRIWLLGNHLYSNAAGIQISGTEGGSDSDVYAIGNVIYGNRVGGAGGTNYADAPYGTATGIHMQGFQWRFVINNTVTDCPLGIDGDYNVQWRIWNNIIASTYNHGNHIQLDTATTNNILQNNLAYQAGTNILLKANSTVYTNWAGWAAAYGTADNCLEADPLFVSALDFHLQTNSPAIGAGLLPDELSTNVFNYFSNLYSGLRIDRDFTGGLSTNGDIGAFAFAADYTPPPPTTATPDFSPASGTEFLTSLEWSLSCATEGAGIYWNSVGSPTTNSTLYTAPLTATCTTNLYAVAWSTNGYSSVASATYTQTNAPASPPASTNSAPVMIIQGNVRWW